MAHVGEKTALCNIGGLGLRARLLELAKLRVDLRRHPLERPRQSAEFVLSLRRVPRHDAGPKREPGERGRQRFHRPADVTADPDGDQPGDGQREDAERCECDSELAVLPQQSRVRCVAAAMCVANQRLQSAGQYNEMLVGVGEKRDREGAIDL